MAFTDDNEPLLGRPQMAPQQVKMFNAGIMDGAGYGAMWGFAPKETDEAEEVRQLASSVPQSRRKRVIIVGAGVSGIQQASVLLKEGILKHEGMQLFDALDDFGGVWAKNTYPGCACDVPALSYTTSYHICKTFTHFYATQSQIQDYYTEFAHLYKLKECTTFSAFVKSCTWDDELFVWHVLIQHKSGRLEHWVADVVCQCVGSLDRPKWGNTPSRENFKGLSWHTAHWRHDVDLTALKVGIVGCGPSAAQIIPEIIDKVKHLTVYMRTPPVCVPRNNFKYSWLFRFCLKYVPWFAWIVRQRMNLRMMMYGKETARNNSPQNDAMNRMAVSFMESQVEDPKLRQILRPTAKYYCKRPLRLDNFYSSLAKPNCTVTREKLVRYTESGVVSADQNDSTETERKFDVIILGTGFNVAQFLEHEKIKGTGGIDLQEKWKEHPEALYGVATSKFPNMFMCFGPNSATVWSSQQDNWELQARFAANAIREIIQREKRGMKLAMYPDRDRERAYNDEVQRQQAGIVWAQSDCVTYYKNDAGWITYTMPWSFPKFWWMLRKIRWNEWVTVEKSLNGLRHGNVTALANGHENFGNGRVSV
ncbi:uncharacterized protein A1O9_12709 [Exophiala aquamarina CBS 119918]|uniref:FAD/NAD(P)-binding domain-containing protein n=1 Tax=Exophiala aquamarina CBS 119918 TaxID=1182545 RepID=A0A072NUB2_9EURO|nr:uncharacterized protein A1O9_12709 [Exophiala aquamarina CBS 119918]KEF51206.1 hypothetical protein A1O9_12709 [Exophiala aquamarina CBS 119918]